MTTKISWTNKTWNPIVGCSIATAGCTNCYAMKTAWRMGHNDRTPQYHGLTKKVNGNAVWTGDVRLVESALLKPLKRKKPTMYFVNSMGDLFHENVPDEWIDRVFAVMALCPQHTFQVLTKRSERMWAYLDNLPHYRWRVFNNAEDGGISNGNADFCNLLSKHLPNVWLGVSVENQTTADERIPQLLATPAALRFISAEPLLGPVDITGYLYLFTHDDMAQLACAAHGNEPLPVHRNTPAKDIAIPCLDWVICGGESGASARPMHPDWARSLRDQCADAGVPFFFKQWGEWGEDDFGTKEVPCLWMSPDGTTINGGAFDVSKSDCAKPCRLVVRLGKNATGNLLDSVTYEQMPEVAV